MKQYVADSLAAGLIHPPSYPMGAGIFFIKKDGFL